jgi:hypothetical protein
MPLDWTDIRRIAGSLPGTVEGTSYGTPSFRVGRKFLTRLKEDGESLVVLIGLDEREMLMESDPATFYITDHYRDYPAMLVRLSRVDETILRRLLQASWRGLASKKLVAAYEAGKG